MSESDKDLQTFNNLVLDVLKLVTGGWTAAKSSALTSKDYRLEVEYSGPPSTRTDLTLYKKASGYAAPGQIKPGLILMGAAAFIEEEGRLLNLGNFTYAEMNAGLQELYNREAKIAIPAKQIYALLEPFIEKDDKITVFKGGIKDVIVVLNTNSRIEVHLTREYAGQVDYDFVVGFRTHEPHTAIRSIWGAMELLPGVLAEYLPLVEDRKFNVVRRVKKNGRTIRANSNQQESSGTAD